jgi:ABC-type Fe3+-hydroxamate transport system substrate-binding protein
MRPILLAPLLLLAACGKPAEKATVQTPGTQVQTGPQGAQVTVTDAAGQTTTIKAGAPAAAAGPAAPGFAPVYPGAAVLSRVDTPGGGGAVTILKFTTKDTPDQVLAFYRDAARKAGVPVSADLDMGGSRMFAAEEEGGARGLQLTAAAANGLTMVQLTYHAPKG